MFYAAMGQRRSLAIALACALVALVLSAPADAQIPDVTPGPPVTVDGPSAAITSLGGISIAHDGTGGLVYLKGSRVYFSSLAGGAFQAPEQLDGALGASPSSQSVIAAANDGLVLVAFINAGNLYGVSCSATACGQPAELFAGASNPALSMNNGAKAYLAFTAADPSGGDDVRSAYYYQGTWQLESTPLNIIPGDDAGTGSGRPAVVSAGDGVGIVVWGEGGHVYSRRVVANTPSVAYQQADVLAYSGWSELSAGQPVVSAGADSSYAAVVFGETLTDGTSNQDRVLMRQLVAGSYQPPSPADGLTTPGSSGAENPQVALTEYGRGWATSDRTPTHDVVAEAFAQNVVPTGIQTVNGVGDASAPFAVPGVAGLFSTMIAWQRDPGAGGSPEIRFRYAPDGTDLGEEQVLSSAADGPTDAADGLAAGGDYDGNAAVAWMQGAAGQRRIVADLLYKPPGGFGNGPALAYSRTSQPTLTWSSSHEAWGPISYAVRLDGAPIGQTQSQALAVPAPLPDGPHAWQVTATNPVGLQSFTGTATVFVDTVAPVLEAALAGTRQVGKILHLSVRAADLPPAGLPPQDASGVEGVTASFGDGSVYAITSGKYHAYSRPGSYLLTVTVTDRAGNSTSAEQLVKIKPKPKPKPKKKKKKKPKPKKTLSAPHKLRDSRDG